MARFAKGHHEEFGDDDEDHISGNGSSSQRGKMDEANRGQKINTHRSKHSETEQRRRIKINERLQILRGLIPQNDQKRDRASFLLEVIEYIQFLQEKLNMYEGSYQGWNQELTKLTPWRNRDPAESTQDHSQAIQDGSGHENNVLVSPILMHVQNPVEPDFGTVTAQKVDSHGLSSQPLPLNVQMQSNMLDTVVKCSMPTQPLHGLVSNANNHSPQPQSQLCLNGPNVSDYGVPDMALNEHEELSIESGSISISTAYSQGILDTLTQALRSSGVDLSQASVSVQIDVRRRLNAQLITTTSSSEDQENKSLSDQIMGYTGVGNCSEDSDQAHKRLRTEAS